LDDPADRTIREANFDCSFSSGDIERLPFCSRAYLYSDLASQIWPPFVPEAAGKKLNPVDLPAKLLPQSVAST
jgi:hypothetical protein